MLHQALLRLNKARLAEDSVSVEIAQLLWSCEADRAAIIAEHAPEGFDVVMACDVLLPGDAFDSASLFASAMALLSRRAGWLAKFHVFPTGLQALS